jgi:hypothetical protein
MYLCSGKERDFSSTGEWHGNVAKNSIGVFKGETEPAGRGFQAESGGGSDNPFFNAIPEGEEKSTAHLREGGGDPFQHAP